MRFTLFKKSSIRSISLNHFFKKNSVDYVPTQTQYEDDSERFSNQELLDAIKKAKDELDLATDHFQYAITPQIIDGCIYKIRACTEYYQYLLKIAKQKNLTTTYIPYQLKKRHKSEVPIG